MVVVRGSRVVDNKNGEAILSPKLRLDVSHLPRLGKREVLFLFFLVVLEGVTLVTSEQLKWRRPYPSERSTTG